MTPQNRSASLALLVLIAVPLAACNNEQDNSPIPGAPSGTGTGPVGCAGADRAIALPDGFCASIVADGTGRARHMTVTPSGDLYVAVAPSQDGSDPGHVLALRDVDGDGVADEKQQFGDAGGNGIAWHHGHLYLARHDQIVRWELPDGTLVPAGAPRVSISGLPASGDHTAKTVVVSDGGELFVNIGSASNACQADNRQLESPGIDPCPELPMRAGVFRFKGDKTGQSQADGTPMATGLRNANALALDPSTGELWGAVNGRDQLFENWPALFTMEDDQELPAEVVVHVVQGADYGWPYCYHDPMLRENVLAPEYGGDGMTVGRCAAAREPELTLPAHWSPLGMLFYTGRSFPERYLHGAFIASHGSRFAPDAPDEPPGYNVVFVPFSSGKPSGPWEEFARGFAGPVRPLPDKAAHRPVGLAEAPDGSLYISDDKGGRIWRIFYGR
jgi:glucose/arabinose dehydrogenase